MLDVKLLYDTVWLNQKQLSKLFEKDQSVISCHIDNAICDDKVDEKSNMQKMHIANLAKSGKFYDYEFFKKLIKSIRTILSNLTIMLNKA